MPTNRLYLMNRLTRILSVTAFLILSLHFQGMAQGLVTPPAGLPQERWELTYDDYRARAYGVFDVSEYNSNPDNPLIPSREVLVGLTREVSWVRDGADVYIKGIFQEYPEAWIKCNIDGDRLTILNNQIIDMNGPIYFHWGSSHLDIGWVHEFLDTYRPVGFADFRSGDEQILFTMSDDGCTVTSVNIQEKEIYKSPSFWFDNDVRGDWFFGSELGGYPDVEYMVKLVFRKIGDPRN